jgi:uncharacterized repeat protein (TIGR02543 family)/LPXTG-motif cell wall-anchored protein
MPFSGNSIYGIDVESSWTDALGGYFLVYTIDYDANSGSGTVPSSVTRVGGASVTIDNGGSLSRTGYQFSGWNTAADGSGTAYAAGASTTMTADITLFAQWDQAFTLSYNANGGSGTIPASVTQTSGSTTTVGSGDGLSRTNYVFSGWNTAADGSGTACAPGNTVTILSDITLYAQWTPDLTLTSSVSDGIIYAGGRITLTPNIEGGTWSFNSYYLSRSDYTFKGLKVGKVTVTYTVDGASVSYTVTVKASLLPKTGQNKTLVYIFEGLALLAIGAGLIVGLKDKRKAKE